MLEYLFLIIIASSFLKLITALSIFQYGLGLKNFSFSIVVFCLTAVLTFFVMHSFWSNLGGWEGITSADTTQIQAFQDKINPFLIANSDPQTTDKFLEIYKKQNPEFKSDVVPQVVKLVSFLVTELKEAFYLGLIFILPFIFLDILIVNILMALNITQISAFTVALPLKILVFYLFDGWQLLSEKLLNFYNG